MIEHITHEQAEISNVQRRLDDLSMEVQSTEAPREQLQEEAVSYLGTQSELEVETKLPEVPKQDTITPTEQPAAQDEQPAAQNEQPAAPTSEPMVTTPPVSASQDAVSSDPEKKSDESDWLSRMEAQ